MERALTALARACAFVYVCDVWKSSRGSVSWSSRASAPNLCCSAAAAQVGFVFLSRSPSFVHALDPDPHGFTGLARFFAGNACNISIQNTWRNSERIRRGSSG